MTSLNIGCGYDKKKDFVNLDKAREVNPDIIYDIEDGLPFESDKFNYIFSSHCLEHVKPNKWIFVLNEIARVAKNGCILELNLPFDSIRCRGNIDHYRVFNFGSFEQLYEGRGRNYYCDLKLKPLINHSIIKKIFFYLFPILKANVHFKFEIIKKFTDKELYEMYDQGFENLALKEMDKNGTKKDIY